MQGGDRPKKTSLDEPLANTGVPNNQKQWGSVATARRIDNDKGFEDNVDAFGGKFGSNEGSNNEGGRTLCLLSVRERGEVSERTGGKEKQGRTAWNKKAKKRATSATKYHENVAAGMDTDAGGAHKETEVTTVVLVVRRGIASEGT